jgi:hypothetical protein
MEFLYIHIIWKQHLQSYLTFPTIWEALITVGGLFLLYWHIIIDRNTVNSLFWASTPFFKHLRRCIQKFPDCLPGARTDNGKLSATRCSCIDILWVSRVSFAVVTLCVASQRVIPKVSPYFFIDSVRKLLDTPSHVIFLNEGIFFG